MNKNSKNVATVYTHTSNLGKIKIENNIKTFERFKLNVVADASVRPQTTDYRKLMSNKPTSNLKRPTSNSAITLIALIITIIVLLILAGVTLNMIMGENGIINKAQLAKEKTNETQEKENENLDDIENKIDEVIGNRDNITIDKEEYNRIKNINNYKNEEQVIGTWIDGKPIYRKIFLKQYDTLTSITSGTIIYGTDYDLKDLETLVDSRVMSTGNSYKNQEHNVKISARYNNDSTHKETYLIYFFSNYDKVSRLYSIFEYTKKTD